MVGARAIAACSYLAIAFLITPAKAQSEGRYETHLQPLMILDPQPNHSGSRHRGAAAVVLDRFTGAFRVCEVHIHWPPPAPPGADGTRRCYTTPPLAPSSKKLRFEILIPHTGFEDGQINNSQTFIKFFVTDTATGGVTKMTIAGQRDANNLLQWGQREELTPQF